MPLSPGDPAPHFRAATPTNPNYNFDTVAGRYIMMAFVPIDDAAGKARITQAIRDRRSLFDDIRYAFFGVLRDAGAIAQAADEVPGIRWILDQDLRVSTLFGMADPRAESASQWILLDPNMRVLGIAPLSATEQFLDWAAALPPVDDHAGCVLHAPVLIIPRVFEPALCRHLIGLHDKNGGAPSGFMRDVDGKTVQISDRTFKRRTDCVIDSAADRREVNSRIVRRLAPEIRKVFQFEATRIERFLVACYDGDDLGLFRPHRDNTTSGTAHRRFAVTINLNAEDYDGGDLRFPEFGSRTYRAPTGGAVVFSCSLLHEATPVTRGRRYAFLPFLYDDAAAKQREANLAFVSDELQGYRA